MGRGVVGSSANGSGDGDGDDYNKKTFTGDGVVGMRVYIERKGH